MRLWGSVAMKNQRVQFVRTTVDWERAPNDPMYGGNDDHYAGVGESALKVIFGAHLLADKEDPTSVLDFACATGRVTRWLRAAYPEADLHVADINADWMAWSSKRFNATGWLSTEDIRTVEAPRAFDLIWCGSLATHMSASDAAALIKKFHQWLAPGGIGVVTTHGQRFIRNLVAGTHRYFEHEQSTPAILSELALKGYGYVAHPGQNHGISVNTLEWLCGVTHRMNARVVAIAEHAWDGHHDILAFQKAG